MHTYTQADVHKRAQGENTVGKLGEPAAMGED